MQHKSGKPFHRKLMVKLKPSKAVAYLGVFVLIVAMIFVGYAQPQQESTALADTANSDSVKSVDQSSVDDVVATNIAAAVAKVSNLPVATAISNLAVSAQTKSEYAQTDNTNPVKPQIIDADLTNRAIISYTAVAGDTAETLSVKFGISKETIKWANKLSSDAIPVGKVMKILPVDGVIYSVNSGDTIDSIASKYGVDKTRLILYNDLDVSGLQPNTEIILPSGTLPETERPGYVAPVTTLAYYAGYGSGFGGKTWTIAYGTPDNGLYAHGNCTLYAYNRRVQLGLPVGERWGNASSWAWNAAREGLLVNNTPSVGAIMQNGGYFGHVGIVESILPNGDLSISEMNAYVAGGGYNIVSGRIVSAASAGQYLYIH
jgi:N-acetylmuramoyl-L-alanine amidase